MFNFGKKKATPIDIDFTAIKSASEEAKVLVKMAVMESDNSLEALGNLAVYKNANEQGDISETAPEVVQEAIDALATDMNNFLYKQGAK